MVLCLLIVFKVISSKFFPFKPLVHLLFSTEAYLQARTALQKINKYKADCDLNHKMLFLPALVLVFHQNQTNEERYQIINQRLCHNFYGCLQ